MHIAQEVPPLTEILDTLTQSYRTKLRMIGPHADYFKPIVLKLKSFINNSKSKIVYNFCICGGISSPEEGKYPLRRKFF